MLASLVTDLARHCGGETLRLSPAGHVHFLCDGVLDVTLVDEPTGGAIRAVALPLGSRTQDSRHWESAAWDVSVWEVTDFDGFICRHEESGLVAVTATAQATQLDSVSFPAWLSRLLDRAAEALHKPSGTKP